MVSSDSRGALARTGCDIQEVDQVSDAVRRFGPRYLDRVYTAAEQQRSSAASLAARFAGKEAVLKLIGDADGVDLRDVEITTGHRGRPTVRLSGHAAELARAAHVEHIDISLSHAGGLALAVASAVTHSHDDEPGPGKRHSDAQ